MPVDYLHSLVLYIRAEVCNPCVSSLATLALQEARRLPGDVGAEVAGASGKHSDTILSLSVQTRVHTRTSQRHFILLTVQTLPVFHADFRHELGKDDVIPSGLWRAPSFCCAIPRSCRAQNCLGALTPAPPGRAPLPAGRCSYRLRISRHVVSAASPLEQCFS